jgi:hypothetical protein
VEEIYGDALVRVRNAAPAKMTIEVAPSATAANISGIGKQRGLEKGNLIARDIFHPDFPLSMHYYIAKMASRHCNIMAG